MVKQLIFKHILYGALLKFLKFFFYDSIFNIISFYFVTFQTYFIFKNEIYIYFFNHLQMPSYS